MPRYRVAAFSTVAEFKVHGADWQPDCPAALYEAMCGKTVAAVHQSSGDEGLVIVFTNGTWIDIGFSQGYGEILTGRMP